MMQRLTRRTVFCGGVAAAIGAVLARGGGRAQGAALTPPAGEPAAKPARTGEPGAKPAPDAASAKPATDAASAKPATDAAAKPRMHIGLCTYMVGAKMDLPTLIDACEKSGMEGLELRTEHAHGVEPSLDAAGRDKVKAAFARTKVRLVALGSICEFHSPDPAVVKKNIDTAKEFVKLAADLGAWGVKVRPNGLVKDVPEEKTLRQIGDAIREVAEFAQPKNVALVMEIHGSGTQSPPRAAKIMEFCKHPAAGLCWNSDPTDVVGGSVRESFELCKPWFRHAHVKDLGKGYPFDELTGLMKAAGFAGYAMIESTATAGDAVEYLKARRAAWDKMVS